MNLKDNFTVGEIVESLHKLYKSIFYAEPS